MSAPLDRWLPELGVASAPETLVPWNEAQERHLVAWREHLDRHEAGPHDEPDRLTTSAALPAGPAG
ncbi:hypothetical protein [Paractinoplanes brasiliensis]|uniref:hypothetical protein n=1 Tax=Paractinoplanes brasiliensis TaxID=52695 RepID=UPI00106046CA|nr:hypothetical protein [Actinoplanes brasiliensis]